MSDRVGWLVVQMTGIILVLRGIDRLLSGDGLWPAVPDLVLGAALIVVFVMKGRPRRPK